MNSGLPQLASCLGRVIQGVEVFEECVEYHRLLFWVLGF
jgi:hypothetical protein